MASALLESALMKNHFSLVLVLALAGTACSKQDTPAKDATTAQTEASSGQDNLTDEAKSQKDPNEGNIVLGPKLKALCDMPTANFAFDSDALSTDAQSALNALAECFTTGKAKGRSMRLVGHTDPRGPESYNTALGQRRAASVAKYLATQGLEDDRMESSSRGEDEATGTDDAGWAKDRKVEIFLAD